MLLTLLLLPTRMVAQTDYVKSVTFTALAANPEGYLIPNYACLFDGKKEPGNFSKWYEYFDSKGTYVIFKASKAGVPVGYTITTGNDNANSGCGGRNPLSWKLYGNNTGKDGTWTLIDQVSNDTKLKDVNFASYDFTCKGSTSYKYFKWEITAIHSGSIIQVGEFELKLKTSNQAYAEFNNGTLTFKYGPKPAGAYDLNVGKNHPEWVDEELYTKINKVVFDASFANARPTSCYYWFAGCTELTSIEGIEYLNTENVTDMSNMFNCCTALTSLDVTNFNTAKVTDMSRMFFCCQRLNTLDVSNFNTAKVTDMSYMFMGCEALTSLDLTSFNTAKVTYMHYMFSGCSALTAIYASDKFVTSQVEASSSMFYNCKNLISATKFVNNKTDHKYANYAGYFSRPAYAEFDESTGTLTFRYKGVKSEVAYDLNEGTNEPGWLEQKEKINKVVFDASFANARPTSCYHWFSDCKNLTDIEGIEYLNTEYVTDMSRMFFYCQRLNTLDVSNFNTAKVTDMSKMFYGCQMFNTLDVSKFNTENVTDMNYMFYACKKLSSLNLSNFNTEKVTRMFFMFAYCSALPSLKVSNFNTAKVTDMQDMFSNCSTLTTLDLSNFNTENVTDMGAMFYGCSALTSLDLSNFNTAKVTNMNFMFFECKSLTSLDLSNFNTAEVTKMYRMFEECNQLTTLDLTSFNTAKVTDMERMFESCYDLKTIYVSDNFVTTKVGSSNNMFYYCVNLKGAIDKYYGSKVNHTYANYKTGYFTKLVGKNGDEKIGATGETLATDNLVLEDGKDFVAYEPFTATAASYNRTMKEGTTWATLCLPFEVSLDNQNFRAFKLLSADEGTETVELEEIETSIAAGTPVIIKMKDGETKLNFSVADKNIAKDVQTAATADANYQLQGLYTQKEFSKDADNNCYIVKGNLLMNPAKLLENTNVTKVASKPFRAYMVDNSSSAAGAKMFSIGFNDSTTAIDSLNTIANDKAEYYDLQGKRLNEPQKGINIVKRGNKTMKVIIK